jgi:uncharacterized protein YqjF (DUF2071 family)
MREASRPFLTAQWRNLILLTFAVDPARLIDLVPEGTTLDSWRGQTFVSLVGFQFQETKVLGAPVPFHQNFEEVNLRFYVRRVTEDSVRHGVVFIREIVPRPLVAGMARLLYREPYLVVPMRSKVSAGPPPDVEYQWSDAGRWCTVAGSGGGAGAEPGEGTLEEFLTVRQWGYNGERGKPTLEYRVDHPRWNVWRAEDTRLDCNAETLCDRDLANELKTPMSKLIADGSAVTIHWRTYITG